MILDSQDVKRFYNIWWSLLKFVNAQRKVLSKFETPPIAKSVKPERAVKIRDVLWKEDALLDQFISENPIKLPSEDLQLIASWKHRIVGNFYILKHLKKYCIFLGESPNLHAYGVQGLVSPLADTVPPYLPLYVRAVLLPFEGKIIYDGLISSYSLHFGPGIRADMKMWLRDAEEREGIITSLLPKGKSVSADESEHEIRVRNAKILAEFRKALFKSGLGIGTVEQHAENIAAFAAFLVAQPAPRLLRDVRSGDVQKYLDDIGLKEGKRASKTVKRFVNFLWDTARSNPETLDEIEKFLKAFQRKSK